MLDTTLSPFLGLHAIQAVPASLLNRNDNGATKSITFGGTKRVRVSSQSWKRAIRVGMRQTAINNGAYGLRTIRFPRLTAAVLASDHGIHPDRAGVIAAAVFTALGLELNEKTGHTAVAIVASEQLPARVAAALAEHDEHITVTHAPTEIDTTDDTASSAGRRKQKKKTSVHIPAAVLAAAKAALDVHNTIDLALMGRMLAEIPGGNVDGAVAVAHPFSVDPMRIEPDFFTAVDDAAAHGEPAVTMLDTTDLTAPTLYRYAEIDRRQLRTNLAAAGDPPTVQQLARDAEASFIEWFIRSMPRGKHRSTGANTLPTLVLAEPAGSVYSLADAFSDVIRTDNVVTTACTRLLKHARAAREYTNSPTQVALVINRTIGDTLDRTGFEVADGLHDLIRRVLQ
ncbi:type I-E CRISPR-associated protein Cas7/Cse4/CasC [Nocardia asiatica]|uniref:type I-E CRISPR-associated protein Cas7/Cse4/CasC n=1 Tax=Nocardia asiatica TaxID=209252 RepID=UPI0002D8FE09|nr:type I-E CRISPR-associated protein Cas7/Cse4/CasC [Nocardia asiatica]